MYHAFVNGIRFSDNDCSACAQGLQASLTLASAAALPAAKHLIVCSARAQGLQASLALASALSNNNKAVGADSDGINITAGDEPGPDQAAQLLELRYMLSQLADLAAQMDGGMPICCSDAMTSVDSLHQQRWGTGRISANGAPASAPSPGRGFPRSYGSNWARDVLGQLISLSAESVARVRSGIAAHQTGRDSCRLGGGEAAEEAAASAGAEERCRHMESALLLQLARAVEAERRVGQMEAERNVEQMTAVVAGRSVGVSPASMHGAPPSSGWDAEGIAAGKYVAAAALPSPSPGSATSSAVKVGSWRTAAELAVSQQISSSSALSLGSPALTPLISQGSSPAAGSASSGLIMRGAWNAAFSPSFPQLPAVEEEESAPVEEDSPLVQQKKGRHAADEPALQLQQQPQGDLTAEADGAPQAVTEESLQAGALLVATEERLQAALRAHEGMRALAEALGQRLYLAEQQHDDADRGHEEEVHELRTHTADLQRLVEALGGVNGQALGKVQALRAERDALHARLSAAVAAEAAAAAEVAAAEGARAAAVAAAADASAARDVVVSELAATRAELEEERAAAEERLEQLLLSGTEQSARVAALEDALGRSAAALRAQQEELDVLQRAAGSRSMDLDLLVEEALRAQQEEICMLQGRQEEAEAAAVALRAEADGALARLLDSERTTAEAERSAKLAALALSKMNEAYARLSDERGKLSREVEALSDEQGRLGSELSSRERAWAQEREGLDADISVLRVASEERDGLLARDIGALKAESEERARVERLAWQQERASLEAARKLLGQELEDARAEATARGSEVRA